MRATRAGAAADRCFFCDYRSVGLLLVGACSLTWRRPQWGLSHQHWHYRSYADYVLRSASGATAGTSRLSARALRRGEILGRKTGVRWVRGERSVRGAGWGGRGAGVRSGQPGYGPGRGTRSRHGAPTPRRRALAAAAPLTVTCSVLVPLPPIVSTCFWASTTCSSLSCHPFYASLLPLTPSPLPPSLL